MLTRRMALKLLVLAAALVSIFFLSRFRDPRPVTVKINEQGFVPAKILIRPGTTVIFKNQSEQASWPASNFHPTHTFYPEPGGCLGSLLDACRPVLPGESFSFTFSQIGHWPMHDHLHPGLVMIVEVESGRPNPRDAEKLRDKSYAQQLETITKLAKKDAVQAWDYLKQAFLVQGEAVAQVHEFTHIVGNELYRQYGIAGIGFCEPQFAFGCYHGVTEATLLEKGLSFVPQIQKQCMILMGDSLAQIASCIHGIGHGLLAFDLLDLGKALADCDLLDPSFRRYCYDGVFMENAGSAKNTSSWDFCADLDLNYQESCARYQVTVFYETPGQDFVTSGQFCSRAPSQMLRQTCAENLGFLAAQIAAGEPEQIASSCSKADSPDIMNFCIIGSAKEVIFQAFRNWEESAEMLCAGLTGNWQSQCQAAASITKKNYNR